MTDTTFEPISLQRLQRTFRPLSLLVSPVSNGLERVPKSGPVLFVGNHTIYGGLDLPMLGLEIYARTGRPTRGLADHFHYSIPGWRDLLAQIGGVRGTRENCARLFEAGEQVIVFPGGAREVNRRKGEAYQLLWKERIGFVRLAIEHRVPIVPFASVGVEEMFEIVSDAEDLLRSPAGQLLRSLGVTAQQWFRGGEIIPPLARGRGPAGVPRLERQYFLVGPPIDTARFAGRHEDAEACLALRDEVRATIEDQIEHLRVLQASDPDRYPIQRLLRRLTVRR